MQGLMQDWPLLVHKILDHAARYPRRARDGHPHGRRPDRPHHLRRDAFARAPAWPRRWTRRGIRLGDRVGTLAWNTARHFETWYGIMGTGAVCHTINPRLFPEQIAYIINHAEDA